jgi:hypothetical protein
LYNSLWIEFTNADTDVVRAPVFGDVHDRYYYASTSFPPRYNTRARIEAVSKGEPGNGAWLLGINPPTVTPTLEVEGGSVKADNVRVATTVAGALATDFWESKVVDGVTLKKDDRIFIKDQVNAEENGIYIVKLGTGTPLVGVAPVRAGDMDSGDEFVGRFFKVLEGTVNGGSSWKITNPPLPTPPPVLGTTPITSEEVSELPLQVTRAYVYTWVTEYKEESAPSPPVIATGIQDGSWNLSGMGVPSTLDQGYAVNHNAVRWITKTRIYRTITSNQGVATFFFVAEQDCTLTSYTDTLKDDEVSSNAQLETFSWTPPPPDLQGLVVMWNGIIAGWRENELWLCEPYRPHAWPAKHVNTMEYPIVGLGVAGQTLVVCTAGNPVSVNGSVPEAMTTSKVPKFEPCTSRGSILSSAGGVFFTSPNGLILCNQGAATNVTESLLTRDKWQFYTREAKLRAAWLGGAYYAFGSVSPGVFELTAWAGSHNDVILIETDPPIAPLTREDEFDSGFDTGFDSAFGPTYFTEEPMPDWISKFDETGAHNGILIDPTDQRIAFNTLTSEAPVFGVQNDPWSGEVLILRGGQVNWLDLAEVNHSLESCLWKSKVFQMPDKKNIGAMRVYFKTPEIVSFEAISWGVCRVYADDRLVYTRGLMKSGEIWKLPSGFKADFWQYEVETSARVLNIQVASSTKELISV